MKPEDRMLFAATRQNFSAEYQQRVLEICRQHPLDWRRLLLTAIHHGVEPLIYANLRQLPQLAMPRDVADKFKQHLTHNVFVKERMFDLLLEILPIFDRYQVPVMLVKGAVLDRLVYEHAWYTTSEDIDLLIKPRRAELEQIDHGAVITALDALNDRAELLKLNIEFDCYAHHDLNMNGVLPIDFERVWRDADWLPIESYRVAIMSPEDLLIAACINACRKRFFRLKAVCDLTEIVGKQANLNWTLFVEKATAYQCGNIVYAALTVAELTLGCAVPTAVLAQLKTSRLRKFLIRFTARGLLRLFALDTLSRYTGRKIFGRVFGLSLVLPYVTYHWDQVGRKAHEIRQAAMKNEQVRMNNEQ